MIDVAGLVTDAPEAIQLTILEVPLLNLITIKNNPRDAVWYVRSALELAVYGSIHILNLLELNILLLKVVVLAHVRVLQDLFHGQGLQLFPASERILLPILINTRHLLKQLHDLPLLLRVRQLIVGLQSLITLPVLDLGLQLAAQLPREVLRDVPSFAL